MWYIGLMTWACRLAFRIETHDSFGCAPASAQVVHHASAADVGHPIHLVPKPGKLPEIPKPAIKDYYLIKTQGPFIFQGVAVGLLFDLGGCQNYGPLLGAYHSTAPSI